MDVKKNIELLCLANGNGFSRDVFTAWEAFIKDDIEEKKYEIIDVDETIKRLIRSDVSVTNYGSLYSKIREAAKNRIGSENVRCHVCRRELKMPAEKAILGELKTGCACGETNKTIIKHYQDNPVIISLWGSNYTNPPMDLNAEPHQEKNVEYYD